MSLQYLQDNMGNTTAVVVPIEEWKRFTEKYNDLEELPGWQQQLIDQRLNYIKNYPDQLLKVEDFINELDRNEPY